MTCHHSAISVKDCIHFLPQVSFDEFNLSYGDVPDGLDFSGSDEDGASNNSLNNILINGSGSATSKRLTMPEDNGHDHIACYRLGSIGEDSHLCLWDLTEDILTRAKLGHSSSHGMPFSRVGTANRECKLSFFLRQIAFFTPHLPHPTRDRISIAIPYPARTLDCRVWTTTDCPATPPPSASRPLA